MLKLDYTIEKVEDRIALVNKILEENPEPPEAYLDLLANYIVIPIERKERKQHNFLTQNRLGVINEHETSYEGLVSSFENSEDGIFNLIHENKIAIFKPKVSITKKDIEEIEPLRQVQEAIRWWEEKQKTAEGRNKYIIKKAIIELRKDQYIIKNAYRRPIVFTRRIHSKHFPDYSESYYIAAGVDETPGSASAANSSKLVPQGYSFANPKVISAILCNYSRLKEEDFGNLESDSWYMMLDFDDLATKVLKKYPLYERIVIDKIDNMQNIEIQADIEEKFGIKYSLEYISSLWRRKIPNLIAGQAENDLLNWHYLYKEKGKYKKCSKCGQIKLAHNNFFSKNKTSRDGWYSVCKECRNKQYRKMGVK